MLQPHKHCMKPKIDIFQRTKNRKLKNSHFFHILPRMKINFIANGLFSHIRSHIITLQVCTYHNEIVEQFLFEVLGNLIQVVGDEMMVTVDGNTSWQLHKHKKNHEHMNIHITACRTLVIPYEVNEDSLKTT